MTMQAGFFDGEERLAWLSAAGDPLERLAAVVDFELFRGELERALKRSNRARGGRPPYDAVLMFRVLVLQTLYTLSDDQTEYQLRDRLSFMRFVGLALHEPVPDAKTIWLYREQLVRVGSLQRLFARFDRVLREKGYLAMGGQIVDATIIEARRPRLTQAEKETIKGGGVPAEWKPARRSQIDRDGRWTLKRGKKREAPPTGTKRMAPSEIVIPAFGYKNHVGIDRTHGFVRRFPVTHAAAPDGRELGRLLDGDNLASSVWADTAYRSQANMRLIDRRGLVPEFQRRKPRGRPMPAHIRRGNATRARVRARVEHVFAAEKRRLNLVIRTIAPKSPSPIWPTTSPASRGSRAEQRQRDRQSGRVAKPLPLTCQRGGNTAVIRCPASPQPFLQPGISRCPERSDFFNSLLDLE
jgi:IS5 family transposase